MEEEIDEGNVPTLSLVRNAIYGRVMIAVHVLAVITSTKLKGADDHLTLKTVAKAYKVLTLATKEVKTYIITITNQVN